MGNRIVTNEAWGVSFSSGHGIDGVVLNVYKFHGNKCQRGQAYGMTFANSESADVYALEHGYTKYTNRNAIKFHSNRSFRRHTGKACMNPDDRMWQLHISVSSRNIK